MRDQYALHRFWWDWSWVPDDTSRDWTTWDYVLVEVYQLIEDFTDSESGQLVWIDQSGDVYWDVRSKYSGSLEAIAKEQEARGELDDGERLYAVPVFDEKKPKPTIQSWTADMSEGIVDRRPSAHRDARPPTPAELAALG